METTVSIDGGGWDGEAYQERVTARKDREQLAWHVDKMRSNLAEFLKHLREIHEKKLYRHDFASFEDFCVDTLKITPQRAGQLLRAENLRVILEGQVQGREEMETVVSTLPESQLRELATTTPEKAVEVLETLVSTGEKPTAKKIREKLRPESVKPRKTCPHCGEEL